VRRLRSLLVSTLLLAPSAALAASADAHSSSTDALGIIVAAAIH
jgi:hypothetical protein